MHGYDFIQDLAVIMMVAGLVGWLCHWLGLSAVVGYLAAGMLIGPYTPPFALVTNITRIETLAQVGLVFLMFSIGMKLSLRKLKRLGLSLVVATFVGAFVMFNVSRAVGAGLGWGAVQTIFLAAMLMVSSSSIISKVLQDLGVTHEKSGQLAMGVSVLEDIVAVMMLTILSSITAPGGGAEPSVGGTLGLLGAFIVVAGIGGLLAVPWLLRKMSISADQELMTIVTAGLLFVLAILSQKAGFSLALGAFLLGAIVAETPHRSQVDRTFEGMRDVFSAVFFVAIGMMIDLHSAGHLWWLILLLTAVTLLGRTLALTTGLLVTGLRIRDAVSVGLTVTPLGEFSFIIAQMGVLAGVLSPDFQAVAVGVSLLTTLAAPLLTRRAKNLGEAAENRAPRWLAAWLDNYQGWLAGLTQRQKRSVVWQLSRKRVISIAVEALLITGLLVFSESIYDSVAGFLPGEQLFPRAQRIVYGLGLMLVVLLPLLALWRNVSALAMIYAEMTTAGHRNVAKLRALVEHGIKLVVGILIAIWLSAVVPIDGMGRWVPLVALALAATALVFLRSQLIYWHSVFETELQQRLVADEQKFTGTTAPWLAQHADWHLALNECVVPDQADCRGRNLRDLGLRVHYGCVVAGIERQGVMIGNPSAETALYPRDKVLLLGDPKYIPAAKKFLTTVSGEPAASNFDEMRMETVPLPADSKLAGRTLAELGPLRIYGVQVAGINRGGQKLLNPRGAEKLLPHDDVLVLGRPDQIAAFRAWANGE